MTTKLLTQAATAVALRDSGTAGTTLADLRQTVETAVRIGASFAKAKAENGRKGFHHAIKGAASMEDVNRYIRLSTMKIDWQSGASILEACDRAGLFKKPGRREQVEITLAANGIK